MFIFIGISPFVLFALGCVVILVLGGHITTGLILASVAILAGAGLLTALGVTWLHARFTSPGLSADYAQSRSRLTARAIVTPDGIMEQATQPVWPSQPHLAISQPIPEDQIAAVARYLLTKYGEETSLAELEAKASTEGER